ncbi:MAG TPA: hypothetical protein VN922_19380 [Bacteroidia bacterium]|nr:hypothetical protein [Bacteroidia bacterium]
MNKQIFLEAIHNLEAEQHEKAILLFWIMLLFFITLGCIDLYYRSKSRKN